MFTNVVPIMPVHSMPHQMDHITGQFQSGLQLQHHSKNATDSKDKATYLKELLADKIRVSQLPSMFIHVEKMLDEEIARARALLFETSETDPLRLPSEGGKSIIMTKKISVPQATYPDYNFVGRILGPRGLTLKQIEQETGCKVSSAFFLSFNPSSDQNTRRWIHAQQSNRRGESRQARLGAFERAASCIADGRGHADTLANAAATRSS